MRIHVAKSLRSFSFRNLGILFRSSIALMLAASVGLASQNAVAQDAAVAEPPAVASKVDAGQADLDEAIIARIDAETSKELQSVTALLESALAKGLGDENKSFAQKMIGSVKLQRSQALVNQMMRARGRAQATLRDEVLETLESAVENDPGLVEAHLLIARMNLLPGGDTSAVTKATTKAIELLKNSPTELSAAYVLRSVTYDRKNDDKRLADLNAALEADKENIEALQSRAAYRIRHDEVDGAIADLESILTIDPTNQPVAEEAVQQMLKLNRIEAAMSLLNKALEAKPSEGMYRMRALLHDADGKHDEALADLNKAAAMQPRDPLTLLQRAENAMNRKDVKSAKSDLRAAIKLEPRVAESNHGILVECLIAIEEGRMTAAVSSMEKLVARDPTNIFRQRQLANLYLSDERPRKAIDTLTKVLETAPKDVGTLRSRGDALLAVGDHKKAIADYESSLKAADEDTDGLYDLSGILNNLAWVLATSPKDDIRDGKRAVELGKRAVDLIEAQDAEAKEIAAQEKTEYELVPKAHILSTLAAGFAEVGNFEKAIEWSTKCIERANEEEHKQLEQLQEELDSYKAGKPWREKQETEENAVPIISADDLIDT